MDPWTYIQFWVIVYSDQIHGVLTFLEVIALFAALIGIGYRIGYRVAIRRRVG